MISLPMRSSPPSSQSFHCHSWIIFFQISKLLVGNYFLAVFWRYDSIVFQFLPFLFTTTNCLSIICLFCLVIFIMLYLSFIFSDLTKLYLVLNFCYHSSVCQASWIWDLTSIMVNFMCQLEWVMGCSNIWPNIVLDVSVNVFLNEMDTWINRLSKADCPLSLYQLSSVTYISFIFLLALLPWRTPLTYLSPV